MAIRIPSAPGVSGKNGEGKDVRNGKASRVAGSKKAISGSRKKPKTARAISKKSGR
jgi:hypothetical protein